VKKADILILGAGCSGTSLAHYLEDAGYQGKIVLLDSRTKFDNEQRWCTWSELPNSMSGLVQKSWNEWTVRDENHSTSQNSNYFSYKQIYAPQFFSHFHSQWQKNKSGVELNSGEKVEQITEKPEFVEVTTNRETWQSNMVFDARHKGSINLESIKNTAEVYLHQTFLGWEIEFPEAVFDEKKATLMDFRTDQIDGVNFIYVLPYSNKKALVESTSFSTKPLDPAKHTLALEKYITENYGNNFVIKSKESGQLPMTSAKFPLKTGERIYSIGIAGGNARPSSGYAFHRIQRQTSEIARSIMSGKSLPQTFASSKYNFFDDVFLNLIAEKPASAKAAFMLLFDKVSPDVLIRFLTDESSYSDDLAIIAALPKMLFGKIGLQSILRKPARQNETPKSFTTLHNPVVKPAQRLSVRQIGG
jgi:lycopene beta-cyclase